MGTVNLLIQWNSWGLRTPCLPHVNEYYYLVERPISHCPSRNGLSPPPFPPAAKTKQHIKENLFIKFTKFDIYFLYLTKNFGKLRKF